jgi:hypothetical protein
MAKKVSKHIGHYISLFLIFAIGISGLLLFHSDKKLQMAFVILIAIFYIIWGIVHHAINHSLNSKIVVEYILIGSLGIAALVFLIMGAFGI